MPVWGEKRGEDAMEEIQELKERISKERPVDWESFPDIGMYMDQIISYMPRQLIHYGEEERLTSAMVNNYIKDGLLPRAEGKRYSPVHLAYLTAICALKQVLTVRDIGWLMEQGVPLKDSPEELYRYFCTALDSALSETAQRLDGDAEDADLPRLALNLALRSYADQLACRRVLEIMRQHSGETEAHRHGKKEK